MRDDEGCHVLFGNWGDLLQAEMAWVAEKGGQQTYTQQAPSGKEERIRE